MNILDYIFPKTCAGCGEWGEYLCADCLNQIKEKKQQIYIPKKHYLEGLTVVFEYKGILKKIIKNLKYKFLYDLEKILVELCLSSLGENSDFVSFSRKKPILIPIPLHPARLRWRGFNQSERLGKQIAQGLGIPINNQLLKKVKPTKAQSNLDKKTRWENVKGAFAINGVCLKNSKYLLFDDIWTTGATMSQGAKIIKRAGAKKVWGLTLAG